MFVIRLPNGNLMVPQSATANDGRILGDVYVEIGPDDPALVRISDPIPLRDIVSAHVDDPSAAGAIGAAVAALAAADGGDADARFVVDGAGGYELLWYATQEIADLVGSA